MPEGPSKWKRAYKEFSSTSWPSSGGIPPPIVLCDRSLVTTQVPILEPEALMNDIQNIQTYVSPTSS